MKSAYHETKTVPAIAPAVKTAAENGTPIDLKGFSSVLIIVNSGAIAGAGDFSFKLQESDVSGSGYTDVAAADMLGSIPATLAASSCYRVGYIGKKRYVRVATIYTGGTSITLSAVAALSRPALAPVA